jgi:hypothetical protein
VRSSGSRAVAPVPWAARSPRSRANTSAVTCCDRRPQVLYS